MRSILLLFLLLLTWAGPSLASNYIDDCGFGKKIARNEVVIGVINIFISPATYASAVTSGTSECSGWSEIDQLLGIYIRVNYESLQEEASQGQGPHLEGLARLAGCPASGLSELSRIHHSELFGASSPQIPEILTDLHWHIQNHPKLSQGCGWSS